MSSRRRPAPASVSRAGDRLRVMGVTISHPDKVWWPDEGITKLDVVRFYADVAPRLLPWTSLRRPQASRSVCDG